MRCGSCNAVLDYSPGGSATIACRYCGQVEAIDDEPPATEQVADLWDNVHLEIRRQYEQAERPPTNVVRCENCAGETTWPAEVVSDRCPFCGSPIRWTELTAPVLAPSGLLPFAIDRDQARAAVHQWWQALWLLPRSDGAHASFELSPIYVPYWNFQWHVHSRYRAYRATGKSRSTRWTEVTGRVETTMNSSMVLASNCLPREIGFDLEPWDTGKLVAPRAEYLMGVRAETYAVGPADGAEIAFRELQEQVARDIAAAVGGDNERVDAYVIEQNKVEFQLRLMPIWIAHYCVGTQSYRVFVNARTAEVIGERPVSRWRLFACAGALTTSVAGVAATLAVTDPFEVQRWVYTFATMLGHAALVVLVGIVRRPQGSTARRTSYADSLRGSMQDNPHAQSRLLMSAGALLAGVASAALAIHGLVQGTSLAFEVAAASLFGLVLLVTPATAHGALAARRHELTERGALAPIEQVGVRWWRKRVSFHGRGEQLDKLIRNILVSRGAIETRASIDFRVEKGCFRLGTANLSVHYRDGAGITIEGPRAAVDIIANDLVAERKRISK